MSACQRLLQCAPAHADRAETSKESGAPDLKECSTLMEQVAGCGACAVDRLCDVSGRLLLQTRRGKNSEAPSNTAFVWIGGGVIVWRWDSKQTNPPVMDQVPRSSAVPAEAEAAKKKGNKKSHDF